MMPRLSKRKIKRCKLKRESLPALGKEQKVEVVNFFLPKSFLLQIALFTHSRLVSYPSYGLPYCVVKPLRYPVGFL